MGEDYVVQRQEHRLLSQRDRGLNSGSNIYQLWIPGNTIPGQYFFNCKSGIIMPISELPKD